MQKQRPLRKTPRSRKAAPAIETLSEDALLATPMKALKLKLAGTWAEDCLAELNEEFRARNIKLRIHGWLSEEWFTPQNVPGIAFPFYLAHPRLMRLERKMMLEAEGGTKRDCMRILRHEAGHVVQYAFGLHRRAKWRRLFGNPSKRYPEHYRADPTSKKYVQYLRRWYAQCHPDEDFAETFAVWLTPRSNWRKTYAGWPALKKLEYVDELMRELAGVKPAAQKRVEVDPLSKLKMSLDEHYDEKRQRFAIDSPTVLDRDLKRIFSDKPADRKAPPAATIIRRDRAKIVRAVARTSGEYPFALDAALDDMITRSQALKLRAPAKAPKLRAGLTAMLNSKAVHSHYLSPRRHWFAV